MDSGILLIDKRKGFTSQKIDTIVKKTKNYKKVGHLGTLDPLAEGLLVLLINDATKYAKYFSEDNKSYMFTLILGMTSDSLDRETEITYKKSCDYRGKEAELDEVLLAFIGENIQQVPLYSAVKVEGEALYKYARRNKDVELPYRPSELYSIKRISDIRIEDDYSLVDIEINVSKGFYVRELARQIGDKINMPSMCEYIKRTSVGVFDIKDAISMDDLDNDLKLLKPDDYIKGNTVKVNPELEKMVLSGMRLGSNTFKEKTFTKIYSMKDELLAYYVFDEELKLFTVDLMVKK